MPIERDNTQRRGLQVTTRDLFLLVSGAAILLTFIRLDPIVGLMCFLAVWLLLQMLRWLVTFASG